MFAALKRHPFPVVAHFERVLAVSFAFPVETLQSLVPNPLEVDCYEGLGFVTVALVWTKGLRPAALPALFGQDFFLAGYRVFVRAPDGDRRLRGLRILRSETDKSRMVFPGNLLTHYNYRRSRITDEPGRLQTHTPDGSLSLDLSYEFKDDAGLPEGSPFPDWRTARRFAGPMPFTFDVEPSGDVIAIEGKRATWKPQPFIVRSCKVGLFEETPFRGIEPRLANAFAVRDISYRWERGRLLTPPYHVQA
jgi:hypothetical protein